MNLLEVFSLLFLIYTLGQIYASNQIMNLFMFIENGCSLSESDKQQYCNYLLMAKEDSTLNDTLKTESNDLFEKVNSSEHTYLKT